MAYWRKLFLVVLLALSLPAQSFAAVFMQCESLHVESHEVFAQHANMAEAPQMHHMHGALMAQRDATDHAALDHSHHAHSCAACASCCVGAALPAVPNLTPPADAVGFAIPLPRTAAASFLTGGVERPPRHFLV
jgi:hypothetical protein